jgi:hypothetical protein
VGPPRLLRFSLLWRCGAAWYAFLIIGIPLIFIGGSAIRGNLFTDAFPFASFQTLLVALILSAIKGPVEEFGWRGLGLPLLQRKFAPIWAGLILGVIWGLWHFPAFLLSETQQSEWSFTAFFAGCLAISVIVTALFNRSHGSILLSAFFHFQLMNPIFPDAQPYDIPANRRCQPDRLVEPQGYVHKRWVCHGSHSKPEDRDRFLNRACTRAGNPLRIILAGERHVGPKDDLETNVRGYRCGFGMSPASEMRILSGSGRRLGALWWRLRRAFAKFFGRFQRLMPRGF